MVVAASRIGQISTVDKAVLLPNRRWGLFSTGRERKKAAFSSRAHQLTNSPIPAAPLREPSLFRRSPPSTLSTRCGIKGVGLRQQALGNPLDRPWERLAFGGEDAGRQRLRAVVSEDRHGRLQEHPAVVVFVVDEMDRAARDGAASLEHGPMDMKDSPANGTPASIA